MPNPLNSLLHSVRQYWSSLASRQKATVAVLFAILLGVGFWLIQSQNVERCPLLAGRALRADESQKIQLALGQAGLSDFSVVDGTILVPRGALSKYVKALIAGNAVPADILADENRPPELNIFMTRQQQESMLRHLKKQDLSATLRKLPFVERVSVDLDASPTSGNLAAAKTSLVVAISPANQKPLSPDQIHTVRRISVGSVATLAYEDVVVVDLASGFAPVENASQTDANQRALISIERLRLNRELEDSITKALTEFSGVVVEVSDRDPIPSIGGTEVVENLTEKKGLLPKAIIGSNGQMSVPTQQVRATPLPAPAKDSGKRIRITVPEISLSDDKTELPQNARFNFEESKRQIRSRAESILAEHRLTAPAEFEVVLDAKAAVDSAQWAANPLLNQFQGRYPGAAIAAASGCLLCVILMMSSRRKTQKRKRSRTQEIAPEETQSVEIRESIDRLIQKDPATVAQVLQDWIRKAG
ncbi:MAG: hypothetical protein ABL888_17575 [Pirellulaceae bacterium]